MKPYFINFNAAVSATVRDSSVSARVTAAAIGMALASLAPLPTSPVESAASFFLTTAQPAMNSQLSAINENAIFDCKLATDFFRSFWMMRYTAAHPAARPLYHLGDCVFESFIGVYSVIPDETHKFLDDYSKEVLMVAMQAFDVFAHIARENG